MSKKVLTIQDVSCFGQCSITVALPILSRYGIETAILPSAILSTHTCGFTDYTFLDLTDEMPKIINHWMKENIKFDAIYTGYIGDERQFEIILKCKETLLKKDGLFIVDPAMADHGKLYPGLNKNIIEGMKKICSVADYIIPNITEACFLNDIPYSKLVDYNNLINKSISLGAKNIILTGISTNDTNIGALHYDGKKSTIYLTEKQTQNYHGTGDIFSSIIVANLLNYNSVETTLKNACEFIVDCIKKTSPDATHNYGVKFEEVMNENK